MERTNSSRQTYMPYVLTTSGSYQRSITLNNTMRPKQQNMTSTQGDWTEKVNELAPQLKKSWFFSKWETHDGAVKDSYITASDIAATSKPLVYWEILWRRELGNLLQIWSQLKDKVKSLCAFSICSDDSTDVTVLVQLGICIRGVDATLTVTEEFVVRWCQWQTLPRRMTCR